MKNNHPIISIVTPSYNHGRFIEDTIQSVLCQRGDFYIDYIIMDGGSKDVSLAIIQKYENLLKKNCSAYEKGGLRYYIRRKNNFKFNNCRGISFRWGSKRDRGQSDAINRGIDLIKGGIFAWINSDDYYSDDGVFAAICTFFENNPEIGMAYGRGRCVDENKCLIRDYHDNCFSLAFDRDILKRECIILQPTVFIRSDVIQSVGGVDESFHWCMDWDLWLRISKKHEIGFIHRWIADWRQHEGIKSNLPDYRMFRERFKVMRRHSNLIEFWKNKWYFLQLDKGYFKYITSLKYKNLFLKSLLHVFRLALFYLFKILSLKNPHKTVVKGVKRLAVFTPLEPQKSGIATFFSNLFFSMLGKNEHLFIDLYINDGYEPSGKYTHPRVRILNHQLFHKNHYTYDAVLYEMGNFYDFHHYMIPYIRRYGGTVELHDVKNNALYSRLFSELKKSFQKKKYLNFLRLIYRFPELIFVVLQRLLYDGGTEYLPERLHGCSVLVRKAKKIILRDDSVIKRFRLPVKKSNMVIHGIRIDPPLSKKEIVSIKKRLHLVKSSFVIVSAGLVQKNKRIDKVLQAVNLVKSRIPGLLYVLAGESVWGSGEIEEVIDSLGLRDKVRLTGWLSMRDWMDYITACDVGVNLRADSAGEHSGPLVTFIERGKPVLISDHDQFRIYPDDFAIKIPVGEGEVERIAEALIELYRDRALRARMAASARKYAEEVLSFDRSITERYFKVLGL